jgi:Fungal specific transcription factor domain
VPTVGWAFLPNDKSAYTNPLSKNIFPLALRDAALFHAILADSGNDMMIRQGEELFDPEQGSSVRGGRYGSIFCMKHKLEGIRILNEKLSHPALCVSDETIIAVCHLIGLEVRVPPSLDHSFYPKY